MSFISLLHRYLLHDLFCTEISAIGIFLSCAKCSVNGKTLRERAGIYKKFPRQDLERVRVSKMHTRQQAALRIPEIDPRKWCPTCYVLALLQDIFPTCLSVPKPRLMPRMAK